MKFKKIDYVLAVFLFVLIIVVGCIVLIINGNKTKDIRRSKAFIQKLYDNDMVENEVDLEGLRFERVDKKTNAEDNERTTIVAQEYGVDLNKDYDIVGFSNRTATLGEVKVTIDDAKLLGEKYSKLLIDKEVRFKYIKDGKNTEELPFYTLVYSLSRYDYQYFYEELAISINKTTGKLDGFSVSDIQGEARKPVINISEDEAKNIVLSKFNEINKEGKIKEEIILAYGLRYEQSSKSELCYVIVVSGKDLEDKEVVYNYFVSTDDGEVVDSFRNVINETKTSK